MDFKTFEKTIGIKFKNKDLLKQAFTHKSYINENPSKGLRNNERMEFLGDAVLELVSTEFLYAKYPDKAEGEMTALRSAMVNTKMLSEVADGLNMRDFMLLSKGESRDEGRSRQNILADVFESVVGAIFLDQGYDRAFYFLENNLFPKLDEIFEKKLWIDDKSLFQEKAQEVVGITPVYKVVRESGPDHAKNFVMGVFLGDEKVAEGSGCSKQEAEQVSAVHALKIKGWE